MTGAKLSKLTDMQCNDDSFIPEELFGKKLFLEIILY